MFKMSTTLLRPLVVEVSTLEQPALISNTAFYIHINVYTL